MTLLTRETIIKHSTFKKVEVDVTEWGEIDSYTGNAVTNSSSVLLWTAWTVSDSIAIWSVI